MLHPFIRRIALAVVLAAIVPGAAAQEQAPTAEDRTRASPAALADVLEDEEARKRLIDDLRAMAAERGDGPAPAEATAEASLPQRLADAVQDAVELTADRVGAAAGSLVAMTAEGAIDRDVVAAAAANLGLLIAATLAVYLLVRRLERAIYHRAGAWVLRAPASTALLRRAAAAVLSVAVDGLTIVLAWLAGWALTVTVLGEAGTVDTRLALFLNAFVAIEAIKLALRVVFAPRDDGLRLAPISAETAAYWHAWLAHLVSFVGYGTLLVVPIVENTISAALGQLVYVLVVLAGFVYALAILLQNRRKVRQRLETIAETAKLGTSRVAAAVLARTWHLVAIAYLLALTLVLLTRPEQALPFLAGATAQTLGAIGLGVLIGGGIGRAISRGIHVPAETRTKFPQLEPRLNAFVPRGLQVMRLAILVLVAAAVLDAWHLFDLSGWLGSPGGREMLASIAAVAVILLLAAVAWIGFASWIDYALSSETGTGEPNARQRTLLALFRNALAVVIVTLTTMIVLSELGIDIGPLLAGAGVLGLALGFGAQKLVQDIIGGVFIQLENAINTGDWVTAGGISGTAERLSIRSVGLRDLEGTFHIVPFSSVDTVSNYMRDFAYHIGYYGIAYREDTDEAIKYLIAAFDDLQQDPDASRYVDGDLTVDGISAFADSSVNLRIRIRTVPGYQWYVGRAYNRYVKKHFDTAGIEIPFPHTTLYFGQDKDGSAPPAHVRLLEQARARADDDGPQEG